MDRFFGTLKGEFAFLSEESEHHLLKVLRAKEGEPLEIVDQGVLYSARVESVNPLSIRVLSEISRESELSHSLYLAFSLLKGGHDELVLQKGTELGVAGFIPYISSRSVIRLDKKDREKRFLRFQKILEGASMQSKRLLIPSLSPILDYKDVLKLPFEKKLFAYEDLSTSSFNLPEALRELPNKTLALVGPEGGFSPEEAKEAETTGFLPISLGKRILRAETASIYLGSVFSFLSEKEKE